MSKIKPVGHLVTGGEGVRDADLQQQIRNAQKALESWPEWMKQAGHFAGSETKDSANPPKQEQPDE